MEQGKSRLLATVVLGMALVVAAWVGANALLHRNDRPKIVTVKGGAERDFVSDLVVWKVMIVSHSATPLEGLHDVERQQGVLRSFLEEKGVKAEELAFGPISYAEDVTGYFDGKQDRYVELKNGYNVSQIVTVTSNRVDDVDRVARSVGELIAQDVTVKSDDPQYYYTKLADLKLEMVAAAAEDAMSRATQIAEVSGAKLGALRRSNLGVFQIVGRHTQEDYSWGGNFNTSSKEKTVTITVTSEFLLK
ncbi:SIMPL domain-containing protein [Porphyromonas levii]|uniref:SIMPL domain-containing protein n=1 Tax=Porphyromonas levii TaxID=28114 RepID=A0A4Y8WQD2_9PORP|nr:SIMPL domain-containing protein [Porphyromonas levii]MBR8801604.1 hypothetical protein [Porphyromonas levii]TFH95996.1 SIMPL domain-containing protein [Porphyromonas levii]TFH96209.1 SIMPL domain-containing protein [Porphyromonas levii]